jgi:3-hydroxyisobutyrate dehydrogenase-like beta-hydroxyacid dehydrogenase
MAPVYPKRNMVPCLISGPEALELASVLEGLPMDVRVMGDVVGRASSIKMVRSIMVKGMEALTAECVLAAVAADVAEEVFPSLKSAHPKIDVPERAAYNFERTLVHGARRAAEMDEVAKMIADLGLPCGMSSATADWQRILSGTDLGLPDGEVPDHLWFATEYLRRLTG